MAETVLNQQEQPKTDLNADTQRQNTHLKKIIGVILSLVMIALTVYVLNLQNQNSHILSRSTDLALDASNHATGNYMTYVGKYKTTKAELEETTAKLVAVNQQLDQVTAELNQTNGMLVQTKGMLSDAQAENARLKQELQGLDDLRSMVNAQNVGELQGRIKTLKDNDSQVSLELADLKAQMRAFQAQFSSFAEGRSLIALFQNKIKLVKSRMRQLNQEAFLARVAAQKEKDRLAALNGNSGFVVRDGHLQNPDGTKKTFDIDVKIVP